ncbi:MAG: fructose-1,6-bisphosphatase [Oscillospiraceae bacterium]|uniref:Fructose-1,6-bisphosphatase class 3 n=1 Tax=Caproicibacterium lactatifermentans TaxID=2666138 RepID=A0A859DQ44_9FIRM|nr:fructose-1,6-bisphosphatase [Caproicibacterium lactatifermentans]MDD4807489.1 fructose-1,6-bisphosphatase [Oscillospiraceae bacterium]QKN24217.1 fructose-bisphosphatase class III [Caproicibacterium lactatifermentans]
MKDERFLKLMSRTYPTAQATAAEIINLKAILTLPKGTEYFFSDLHGESGAFLYQLRSASGVVRRKINDLFEQSLGTDEQDELAALIYYPESGLEKAHRQKENYDDWSRITIYRLVELCKDAGSKYTRSKVRKKMPENFAYIIDELMHASGSNKQHYTHEIIFTIVETGMGDDFIIALCYLIQSILVDRLHIIGDVFDRGPHADVIMDALMEQRDIDIQWGNHDMSWMGAACGSPALVANVVRLGISYNNFDVLEDGYGINLRPLSDFAARIYADDPCSCFSPHTLDANEYDPVDLPLAAKMHKAITIIQLKLEEQLIHRHPEYHMENRLLLERIDFTANTTRVDGTTYPLRDTLFPTVNPKSPLKLTAEEQELMHALVSSFSHSERLQRHIRFLFSNGSMYLSCNSNLLYHGCIPLKKDGSFATVSINGKTYSGKSYFDYIDTTVRQMFFSPHGSHVQQNAADFAWYLWCGPLSPLFGKSKLSMFERYFLDDPKTRVEVMNPYYTHLDDQKVCENILEEFGLDPATSHIINGHVPVRLKEGESPIKAGGKLFMIDGGISKAYQNQTGIGGYTLVYNSHYLALAQHMPLAPGKRMEEQSPKVQIVEAVKKRVTVGDTDTGAELRQQIAELEDLLAAYRSGQCKEKIRK